MPGPFCKVEFHAFSMREREKRKASKEMGSGRGEKISHALDFRQEPCRFRQI